jgi:hypothetical protein
VRKSAACRKRSTGSTRRNSRDAAAAAEKYNALLEQQAERWRDIADPSAKYFAQLGEINKLEEQGRLTMEQADKARQVTNENIAKAMGAVSEQAQSAETWGKRMGLTFSSAAENALVAWKGVRSLHAGPRAGHRSRDRCARPSPSRQALRSAKASSRA